MYIKKRTRAKLLRRPKSLRYIKYIHWGACCYKRVMRDGIGPGNRVMRLIVGGNFALGRVDGLPVGEFNGVVGIQQHVQHGLFILG